MNRPQTQVPALRRLPVSSSRISRLYRATRIGAQAVRFTDRFESILAGKYVSNPDCMRQPLLVPTDTLRFCLNELVDEGVIADRVAQELYSYSRELSELAARLSLPRHPNQVKEYRRFKDLLLEQSNLVEEYFWHKMSVAFPRIMKMERSCVHFCWGWRVMVHRNCKCKHNDSLSVIVSE